MKLAKLFGATTLGLMVAFSSHASLESKKWPASPKAEQFVKDSVVLGFLASPYGAGWTEDKQLLDYFEESRQAGITGHDMTLTAASMNFDDLLFQHQKYREAMAQQPDKYTFVRSIRDIESAHIQGKTAVIWNSQTATILEQDLGRMAILKEMGMASMILAYNDRFRTGSGALVGWKGKDDGLTAWGKQVIDELVKYGILLDLSHTGSKTANDAMTYMEENYPNVPFVYTHSLPAGLYENGKEATPKGCYRNISDADALRAAKSGGFISPTFTEWMMDGVWPEDISPQQAADMVDYYVKLVGVDHVGIASDDLFTTENIVGFAKANASTYADDGYMVNAFNKGSTDSGMLARILPAITDELWKRGYTNQDLAKIYGGNKMRVYQLMWEGVSTEQHFEDLEARVKLRNDLRQRYMSK
ncbi:membrane dipeptidase [Vibrio sp. VB16]|uniref:membrane dipeptidase n=1 Tax=Vibrio sp. VB16 TaxID=2785746 RepID=UPI00189F7E7A|nr:membrane dipeptidase [Vibrio sp. VB16]UGA53585.1 dipeptidase [Vibrio sp. VB16]